MKKPVNITSCLMIYCGVTLQSVAASPTEKEFEPCRQLAAKTLEQCLTDNNAHNNDICWSDSKTAYTSCREEIFFNHIIEIRKAKKAAEEKQKNKQLENKSQTDN